MSNLIQRLIQFLRNQVNSPRRALRSYLIFALANSLFKLLKQGIQTYNISKVLTKSGFKGEGVDPFAKVLKANIHRIHDFRTEYLAKYDYRENDFVKSPAPVPNVFAWSPKAVEIILKSDFDSVTKPAGHEEHVFSLMSDFIGEGLFVRRHGKSTKDPVLAMEHKDWYNQRKTTSMIFTKGNFNTLISSTFNDKVKRFVEVLHQHIDSSESSSKAFDIERAFFSYTMDSVQSIFYGRESDTLGGRDDELATAFDTSHLNMMRFLYKNFLTITFSGLLPWPFADFTDVDPRKSLALKLCQTLSPEYQTFRKSVDILDRELHKTISELRTNKQSNTRIKDKSNAKQNNLVSLYLDNPNWTDDELRGVMGNLVIAGRDTTACTLSWMMYELTQHPEVQEKLYEEATKVLSSKNGGRLTIPSHDDVHESKMPYLNAVVYETLRLHPAVPENIKMPTKDIKLDDGKVIPAGTRIAYSTYAMGRDPNRYPEPEKFNPDRWIPFEKPSDYEFPVFQGGPRFCLGRHMAMFEMKLVMAVLMQEFTFSLLPGELEKINYSLFITMSVSNSVDSTGLDRDSMELLVLPKRRGSCRVPVESPSASKQL